MAVDGLYENHDEDYGKYYEVNFDMNLVTGTNIMMLAYAYQTNLFPTYNSLGQNKSTKTAIKAITIAQGLSLLIYISVGIISVYMFGSSLNEDVLDNVDKEKNIYSYILRSAFLVVLACHIPYNFFPTKEAFLILYDEFKNKSMEKAIELNCQRQAQVFGSE